MWRAFDIGYEINSFRIRENELWQKPHVSVVTKHGAQLQSICGESGMPGTSTTTDKVGASTVGH